MMMKRNIVLYGRYVTEVIFGIYLDDTCIEMRMNRNDFGTDTDNVLIDYKSIDPTATVEDLDDIEEMFLDEHHKIRLYLINENINEYPVTFHNTVNVVQGTWSTNISCWKSVMTKTEVITFSHRDSHHHSTYLGHHKGMKQLHNRYGVQCKFNTISEMEYIMDGTYGTGVLIRHDEKSSTFS